MMKELYDLCNMLVADIRNFNAKGNISPTELERVYKAVDIIKDIKTIEAMENYSEDDEYIDEMKYINRGTKHYNERDDKEEMLRAIEEMKRKIEEM